MMAQLYKIIFPNGKAYIGVASKSALTRFKTHRYRATLPGRKLPIHCALTKFNIEDVVLEVLIEKDTVEECYALEAEYILKHKTSYPLGYNIAPGGIGGSKSGTMSVAGRESISSARKKEGVNWKAIKAMNASVRGKPKSNKWKRKMSEIAKNRKRNLDGSFA